MPSPISMTRSSVSRVLHGQFFNRQVKAIQRGNAMDMNRMTLHKAVAEQMFERRCFIKAETPVILEVGAHCGWYLHHLIQNTEKVAHVKQYIQCDVSAERLMRNYEAVKDILPPHMEFVQMQCDEELEMPVPEKSVDMVVSCLSLHWVNNLEQALVNMRRTLKHDGFMLLSMLGGNTLYELRSAFTTAEQEREGGFAAHTNPMIDGAGMSTLMLQGGFHFPTVDMDRHHLKFPSFFHLAEYLQDMGENNALVMRRPYVPRETFVAAAAMYEALYRDQEDGSVPATFEVFHAIGWAPSPNRPLHTSERGSAQISLRSLGSETHKEFQEVMGKLGENPEDEATLRKASELLEGMKKAAGTDTSSTFVLEDAKDEDSTTTSNLPGNAGNITPPPK